MLIEFFKYQGTGNDFIIIDDRKELFDINDNNLIKSLCERRFGIGSDGLILFRNHNKHDFEMIYFNSDGRQSSMCGNGGRCIISFANLLRIIEDKCNFIAIDGLHEGIFSDENISLKMMDVKDVDVRDNSVILDTGSPHLIKIVENIESVNVNSKGRKIRNKEEFISEGINVNFVQIGEEINMRTYERGVEEETLSCGTGIVATAIALYEIGETDKKQLNINTKGGTLSVSFDVENRTYTNIWLSGEASLVFAGDFEC
ncbi:MAG: diaminopimelate epimerase [Flavobacteriales bacterium]|nr:diaminopimelate epimerase [Flavobacteriales bacterium]MBT7481301.1 diaminopimelate epimerase [Flavobacteriales bacterium]